MIRLRKLEWIIELGAIALVTTLLFVGSFFAYWGAWNYVLGSKYGLFFGPPMGLFGGGFIFAGIIVAMQRIKLGERMVMALGVSSLYTSSFFIFFGLTAYFFPRFPGEIYNGLDGIKLGSVMAIIGILLFLMDFVFRKMK